VRDATLSLALLRSAGCVRTIDLVAIGVKLANLSYLQSYMPQAHFCIRLCAKFTVGVAPWGDISPS
jgi:hypothetical protein